MYACVLLSGGASQRFGSPKALASLNGETVLERLQNVLILSQVDEIIIVLGAHANRIQSHILNHTKVKCVYNKDYKFGQTSSFKAGLRAVSMKAEGILLLPVDYPFIRSDTINHLIANHRKSGSLIVIPSFEGQKGHPPLFACSLRDEFLALENVLGLNTVAHAHKADTCILPVSDPGVTLTFNSPGEFEALKQPKS